MATESTSQDETTPAPRKRPAWAKARVAAPQKTASPSSPDRKTALDMFSRSSQTMSQMRDERARRKNLQRQQNQEQQADKQEKADRGTEERHVKRRRVSEDEEVLHTPQRDVPRRSVEAPANPPSPQRTDEASAETPRNLIDDRTDSPKKDNVKEHHSHAADQQGVIELDSDDDTGLRPQDEHNAESNKSAGAKTGTEPAEGAKTKKDVSDEEPPVFDNSDEEMEYWAARAQKKQNRLKEQNAHARAHDMIGRSSVLAPVPDRPTSNSFQGHQTPPDTPETDPVVSIFLHSSIPGTKALIVQRRLSQRLKEVRDAWVKRQESISEDMRPGVFLTWRNRKLFDSTSCKSLGLEVDKITGDVYLKGSEKKSFVKGDEEGTAQLVMEAMTEDILQAEKRKARSKVSRIDQAETTEEHEPEVQAKPMEPGVGKIHVILKSQGYDEYKLLIKPTTRIGQIISVFRKYRAVPESKQCWLSVDGEKLSDDQLVRECDIADMDCIDVYVK